VIGFSPKSVKVNPRVLKWYKALNSVSQTPVAAVFNSTHANKAPLRAVGSTLEWATFQDHGSATLATTTPHGSIQSDSADDTDDNPAAFKKAKIEPSLPPAIHPVKAEISAAQKQKMEANRKAAQARLLAKRAMQAGMGGTG